jgi:hypothetical protein
MANRGLSEENLYLLRREGGRNRRFQAINNASVRSEPPSGFVEARPVVSPGWYGPKTATAGGRVFGGIIDFQRIPIADGRRERAGQ